MKPILSLVMICKNAAKTIEKTLESVSNLTDEIIIIDDFSTDCTTLIAKKYKAIIYKHHEYDLGKQRAYGLKKAKGRWILILDSDEILTKELKKEILNLKSSNFKYPTLNYGGYYIPFQTHFLGKPLYSGGENYSKMILFKKSCVKISPALVHENYQVIKGKTGEFRNKVLHYSYESLLEMYKKFTDYAIREAKQKKINKETSSLKKIFIYPIHMFWARFIKDKGYKDGSMRIFLDLGFAYMEFLTYLILSLKFGNANFITRESPRKNAGSRK